MNYQSDSREIRQKNAQFHSKARAGKNPVNMSRKEKLAKQSPIGLWALGLVVFVVVGGGKSYPSGHISAHGANWVRSPVVFELIRVIFL